MVEFNFALSVSNGQLVGVDIVKVLADVIVN